MIIPHKATIAVVDGKRFRLFRNDAVEPHLHLVELAEPELDPHNPGSGRRHYSGSTNPDASRSEEDGFAAAAANRLNRLAITGDISTLFVIADPRTLGEIRRHYHKETEAKLLGELAKDLTDADIAGIGDALNKA